MDLTIIRSGPTFKTRPIPLILGRLFYVYAYYNNYNKNYSMYEYTA